MSISGNIGEWSEAYVLLKLLGDREVCAGNEKLEKATELVYPILKIVHAEHPANIEFVLPEDSKAVVISPENSLQKIKMNSEEFLEKAQELLTAMKNCREKKKNKKKDGKKKEKKGVFSVPEVEEFMKSIQCEHLKASSGKKEDIRIVIHDCLTGQNPMLGFSIKSMLGEPSTLLNAGKTTRFAYRLIGNLSPKRIEEINELNTRNKLRDRFDMIRKKCEFKFSHVDNDVFESNLEMVDSKMPELIGLLLLERMEKKQTSVKKLTESIARNNPLKFNMKHGSPKYEYKIKQLLTAVALGMMPSEPWSGKWEATGGYLVVKENGDILCYHIYNRDLFENYLYERAYLEGASTSRHGFGKILTEDGKNYFYLALQIRMKG